MQRLRGALDGIRTGAVAPAARDDKQGRFSAGDAVGFVDEEMVAWGTPEATLRAVLEALADGIELLTCVSGEGAPLDDDAIGRPRPRERRDRMPRRRAAALLVAAGRRVSVAPAP